MNESTVSNPAGSQPVNQISPRAPQKSFLGRFQRWEWMLVALVLLAIVINSRLTPYFLNAQNLSRTSADFMELGLMMLPMVFIIITGNIDLSVASNLGMCASLMAVLWNLHVNIWVAAGAGLVLGTLGGLLNGFLIAKVKLPALVATLGTYAFFRGIAYVLLGDQASWTGKDPRHIDPIFCRLICCSGCGLWPGIAPAQIRAAYLCDRKQ
jgi:rhamnose transport system permease protein